MYQQRLTVGSTSNVCKQMRSQKAAAQLHGFFSITATVPGKQQECSADGKLPETIEDSDSEASQGCRADMLRTSERILKRKYKW